MGSFLDTTSFSSPPRITSHLSLAQHDLPVGAKLLALGGPGVTDCANSLPICKLPTRQSRMTQREETERSLPEELHVNLIEQR